MYVIPDLFGIPVVQARTSEHLDQKIGSLREGHFKPALSSVTGVSRATYSTSARLSATVHAAG